MAEAPLPSAAHEAPKKGAVSSFSESQLNAQNPLGRRLVDIGTAITLMVGGVAIPPTAAEASVGAQTKITASTSQSLERKGPEKCEADTDWAAALSVNYIAILGEEKLRKWKPGLISPEGKLPEFDLAWEHETADYNDVITGSAEQDATKDANYRRRRLAALEVAQQGGTSDALKLVSQYKLERWNDNISQAIAGQRGAQLNDEVANEWKLAKESTDKLKAEEAKDRRYLLKHMLGWLGNTYALSETSRTEASRCVQKISMPTHQKNWEAYGKTAIVRAQADYDRRTAFDYIYTIDSVNATGKAINAKTVDDMEAAERIQERAGKDSAIAKDTIAAIDNKQLEWLTGYRYNAHTMGRYVKSETQNKMKRLEVMITNPNLKRDAQTLFVAADKAYLSGDSTKIQNAETAILTLGWEARDQANATYKKMLTKASITNGYLYKAAGLRK